MHRTGMWSRWWRRAPTLPSVLVPDSVAVCARAPHLRQRSPGNPRRPVLRWTGDMFARCAGLRHVLGRRLTPGQHRCLHLHEYQSKAIMASYGVNVQKGDVADTPDGALQVARRLVTENPNARELVVKAQILAGGRGKGHFDNGFKGGVKVCTTPEEIADNAKHMLGANLITVQTGPAGQPCSQVLVHEGISFDRELYFAILLDRTHDGVVVVASKKGGMDIEQVAEESPSDIFTISVDRQTGLTDADTAKLAEALGFASEPARQNARDQMQRLYAMFIDKDATQVEINPLVETPEHKVYCVDAKINFDDNAAFRHKDVFAQRDFSMEDPREVAAAKHELNYVGLDGNIGCMVNGAGLAMATMDIIKLNGGQPANFLDVGGNANEKQVAEAFKILNGDPKVKAILINIFGGIMKCDVIAQGIVAAGKTVKLSVPLIVRLEGTNVDLGKRILQDSGMNIITADNLDDAAKKAVQAIN